MTTLRRCRVEKAMRKRNFTVILFILAMAVQVMSPVMGGMAHAHESAQGETISSLCRATTGEKGEAPASSVRHDICALCQVLCDGVAPVGARDYATGPAGTVWFVLAWGSHDFVLPATRVNHSRQARAPPSFS